MTDLNKENYKLAERLFNAMFDNEDLDDMEKDGSIACKRGYKATFIAEMVIELEREQ